MRRLLVKTIAPFLRLFAKLYFTKPRRFNYKQIKGVILPTVFHPFFTISTKLLLFFVDTLKVDGKKLLELGCGTGMISCLAAANGGIVTATDINPKAVENARLNAERNHLKVDAFISDLFDNIPQQIFDFIIINPPYYPKDPLTSAEEAWFCGSEFEYFEKLFAQIKNYMDEQSEVYMILSEDCDLDRIQSIGKTQDLRFLAVFSKKRMGEKNFLFRLVVD